MFRIVVAKLERQWFGRQRDLMKLARGRSQVIKGFLLYKIISFPYVGTEDL